MASQRATGIVKFFDTAKGFGFIGRQHGDDVFVHISDVQQSDMTRLYEGQQVDFDIKETPKGPQAKNVEAHEFEPRLPPDIEPATVEPASLASVFYAAALRVSELADLDPQECRMWSGRTLVDVDPGFRVDVDTAGGDDEDQDGDFEERLDVLDTLGRLAGLRLAREQILSFLSQDEQT